MESFGIKSHKKVYSRDITSAGNMNKRSLSWDFLDLGGRLGYERLGFV